MYLRSKTRMYIILQRIFIFLKHQIKVLNEIFPNIVEYIFFDFYFIHSENNIYNLMYVVFNFYYYSNLSSKHSILFISNWTWDWEESGSLLPALIFYLSRYVDIIITTTLCRTHSFVVCFLVKIGSIMLVYLVLIKEVC